MLNPPFNSFRAITKHDTVDIPKEPYGRYPDAVFIGGAGNLVVIDQTGNLITFKGVLAGTMLAISPKRINATDSTAADLVACYRV